MKAALIPPIPHLSIARGREFHLCLSHLVKYPQYSQFYRDESEFGSFVILDNSAHEHTTGEKVSVLFHQAPSVGAKEIVIPDTLFDRDNTVKGLRESLRLITRDHYDEMHQKKYSLMMVPQGADEGEYYDCLSQMLEIWEDFKYDLPVQSRNPTIGISKDYEMFDGGLLDLVEWAFMITQDLHVQFHLLGWGRKLWDLREVARMWGEEIRSTDSAKPIVYTLAGIRLPDDCSYTPEYPKRPGEYFSTNGVIDPDLLKHNIGVYDKTVRGD